MDDKGRQASTEKKISQEKEDIRAEDKQDQQSANEEEGTKSRMMRRRRWCRRRLRTTYNTCVFQHSSSPPFPSSEQGGASRTLPAIPTTKRSIYMLVNSAYLFVYHVRPAICTCFHQVCDNNKGQTIKSTRGQGKGSEKKKTGRIIQPSRNKILRHLYIIKCVECQCLADHQLILLQECGLRK